MKQTDQNIHFPELLISSKIMKRQGCLVLDTLFNEMDVLQLQKEAISKIPEAVKSKHRGEPMKVERGGTPQRKFKSTIGGTFQEKIYNRPSLLNQLKEETGLTLRPSGSRGSYTYYVSEGDCLGLHRDIEVCDIAVITTLYSTISESSIGGLLCIYPDKILSRLYDMQAMPSRKGINIRAEVGQSVVLLGGVVPHEVLPLRKGEKRVISILCFSASLSE